LRIRASSAATPARAKSTQKSDSIDVDVGADFITATFNLSDGGVSGSGGFTARVVRTLVDSDLDFADLVDPDSSKSAVLEVDLALDANLSLAYTGGEDPLERKIGTVRIPIRTSIIDAATGLILGRTAVSLLIPFSVVLDANVSANATGAATLKSRFTYSPASGAASSVAGTGGFTFGPPAGGAAATPGASISVYLMLRARPALGFLDPVALLGLDLQGGAELEGKVDATGVDPYYCARFSPYVRFTAYGFFKMVGQKERNTPRLIYRHSLAEFLPAPLELGNCTLPPPPPSLAGITCNLETDARGYWRWTLGGSIPVAPPISAGDIIIMSDNGWNAYASQWWPVSRECGTLAPHPTRENLCVASVNSTEPTSVSYKWATSTYWHCGLTYRGGGEVGCWGPLNYNGGPGFSSPLPSPTGNIALPGTDAAVLRDLKVQVYRSFPSGALLDVGTIRCPEPPRVP